ncbi:MULTISPECIES: lactate dehydrogenase [unclassified Lacticaseibacillus]|uniref:lactate dehydrogenase n=1 Tax=unclassified Lacticaseibacillus TaxID=2759744 RepID=UPI0019444AAF|nr:MULTISPECIES: lactate dehydrogenase [unclassified Lacticaseibacillus]
MQKVVVCGDTSATQDIAAKLIQSRLPLAVLLDTPATEHVGLDGLIALAAVSENAFQKATPKQLADADVLIITDFAEGAAETVQAANLAGMRRELKAAMGAGFSGRLLVATQESELCTHFAQRFSGLKADAVMGLGTMGLTRCFEHSLAREFDVPAGAVTAYVIGTQPDFTLLWSRAYIGATAVMTLLQDADDASGIMTRVLTACQAYAKAADGHSLCGLVERLLAANAGSALIAPVAVRYDKGDQPLVYSRPVQIDRRGITAVASVTGSEAEQQSLAEALTRLSAQIAAIEAGEN